MVVYSATVSDPGAATASPDFYLAVNRANVAFSRAQVSPGYGRWAHADCTCCALCLGPELLSHMRSNMPFNLWLRTLAPQVNFHKT